jgi:arylsulfatase A-like enzyme
MGYRAAVRQARCIGIGLLMGLFLACQGESTPEPNAAGESVVQALHRLDARDFGLDASFHGAVAPIGDEARPVLLAPNARRILSLPALPSEPDGFVRARIELSEAVRNLPEAAFTLEVQRIPGTVTPELMAEVAREINARRVTRAGWLERAADGTASVAYEHGDSAGSHLYVLHVHVAEPAPVLLESRLFEAPPKSNLVLAYGLTTVSDAEGHVPAHFGATLGCDGNAGNRLLEDVVSAPEASGWRELSVPLPPDGGGCRLDLRVSAADGSPIRGAVWAVPRIEGSRPLDLDGSTPRNLVVISLDTLRADHLSGYGYPRETSPRIDAALIGGGATFLDVTSTYSRTDVSHLSLFSGLYPAARPEKGRLSEDTPLTLLAESLRDAGFSTGAFTEDALIAGIFGFWFGFERFVERTYREDERGSATFADGIEYLRANRDRRFFLFLHTYKTHLPYAAGEPYAALFSDPAEWEREGMGRVPPGRRTSADEYDRTIREADDLVGTLLDELADLGLAEKTLVVLLSDHGEAFGEHGRVGHSYSSGQEVIRVPLVLRGPGIPEGLRVDTPASLVDVVPTLLDLLGLAPPELTQGISLVPALRGGTLPERRPIYFAWLGHDAAGVRYGPWKYTRSKGGRSFFDLEADPEERSPQPPRKRSKRSIGERLLLEHVEASARIRERFEGAAGSPAAPISDEMQESLRALGYIE